MRKNIINLFVTLIAIAILFVSFTSAQIILNQEPKELYSMGDFVEVSFRLVPERDLDSETSFSIYLICNGIETNPEKSEVGGMKAKEVKIFASSIFLSERRLGRTSATCTIKGVLEDSISGEAYDSRSTENFKVSDIINVEILSKKTNFNPGETLIVEGEAIKENGKAVDGGFAEFELIKDGVLVRRLEESVEKGYFFFSFTLPENIKAGRHSVNLEVYETYNNLKINRGVETYDIHVNQIPTSLEIIPISSVNREIKPGSDFVAKAILYDQTGEPIETSVDFILKKEKREVLETKSIPAGSNFIYPVSSNEPVSNWILMAQSEGLESEVIFEIIENEQLEIQLINKTLLLINVGNVPYYKRLDIQIGNQSLDVDVSLNPDESQKYLLSAPYGNYSLDVFEEGRNVLSGTVLLTGNVISVTKARENIFSLVNYPIVWVVFVLILGFVAFYVFKGSTKRNFFGYIHLKKNKPKLVEKDVSKEQIKNVLFNSAPLASLSLSIQGNKQKSSVVCLNIKNMQEVLSNKEFIKGTLQEIILLARKSRVAVYENQDKIFFIFSPVKTKTFKNEKSAVGFAQSIEKIISEHNKVFKHNINFGISVNSGEIISKLDKDELKFMSLGGFITNAKRVASISNGEVYLTKESKEILEYEAKTEKRNEQGVDYYVIKEMRNREQSRKFINEFMKRLKEENQ